MNALLKKVCDAHYCDGTQYFYGPTEEVDAINLKLAGLVDNWHYPDGRESLFPTDYGKTLYHRLFPPTPEVLAVRILNSFKESSLYEDYQREDGWTDEQFEAMLAGLRAGPAAGLTERQRLVMTAILEYAYNNPDNEPVTVRGRNISVITQNETEDLLNLFATPM